MSQYEQLEHEHGQEPEWHYFPRTFKMKCCDCSLIHTVKMKVDKRGKVWMKWIRDIRATSASRRDR